MENRPHFDDNIQLLEVKDRVYCLTDSVAHTQAYGGKGLRDIYNDISTASAEDITALKNAGFISIGSEETNLVLKAKIEKRINKKDLDFSLLRILMTDRCNLSCDYCKVEQNIKKVTQISASKDKITEAISFFFSNSDVKKPKVIHCTGGEPLVDWSTLIYIFEEAKRLARKGENYWIVVGTNATLVTDEIARQISEHKVKCIVSMDGPKEIHDILRKDYSGNGSWDRANRGMELLEKHGVEVSISMVVGRHNIKDIDRIVEWMYEKYKPTGLGVNFLKPPTKERQDYEYLISGVEYARTLYSLHKKWRSRGLFIELVYRKMEPFVKRQYRVHDCGAAAGSNLNLDSRNNFGPCKSFLIMEEMALQKLSPDDYKNTILNPWLRRSPIYMEECTDCPAKGICGNGCAYESFISTGSYYTVDKRSCEYTQEFYRLFIEDLYELSGGSSRLKNGKGFYIISNDERKQILGNVWELEDSLSYSIGHHINFDLEG